MPWSDMVLIGVEVAMGCGGECWVLGVGCLMTRDTGLYVVIYSMVGDAESVLTKESEKVGPRKVEGYSTDAQLSFP
jgi:hypothetical protein